MDYLFSALNINFISLFIVYLILNSDVFVGQRSEELG